MRFNFSLSDMILSKARMKLVTFLLNHEAAMSEREIASVLNVSHMSINRFLKEMAEVNLVNYVTIGKAHLWKVNRGSYAFQVFTQLIGNISKARTPLGRENGDSQKILMVWKNALSKPDSLIQPYTRMILLKINNNIYKRRIQR